MQGRCGEWKISSAFSPVKTTEAECGDFSLCLAEIGSVLTKKFSVVRHFFPGLLARGKDLKVFCLFVLPVPIGSSRLGTSRALCPGYMKG